MVTRSNGGMASAARAAATGAALALVVLLGAGQAGCKKSDAAGGNAGRNDAAARRRQQADSAFLGHIPTDTPYLFASLEPIPRWYWRRMLPGARAALDSIPLPDASGGPPARFAAAFLRELRASFDEAGLRRLLGIGMEGRFALYGVGIIPVARLELVDGKALLATIERLQAESGLALPTATLGGRPYWRLGDDDFVIVGAVIDDHLVLAGGPTAWVDRDLPVILGTRLPRSGMGDGAAIRAVVRRHGFSDQGIGYVDARRLLAALSAITSREGSASPIAQRCMDELTQLAQRFPGLAFGYDEISEKRITSRVILETDAALAARLRQLTAPVPGLVGGLPSDHPLIAFGLGLDLATARQLAIDAVDGVARLAGECNAPEIAAQMSLRRTALSRPPPAWLERIDGALLSANHVGFGPDGKPNRVEGYAIVGSDNPSMLLTLVKQMAPAGAMLEVAADGGFHDILPAGAMPGLDSLRVAIKPGALVAALGAGMIEAAERTLARSGSTPLVYVAYDYNRIIDRLGSDRRPAGPNARAPVFWSMFRTSAIWIYPADHGLALAISMELR